MGESPPFNLDCGWWEPSVSIDVFAKLLFMFITPKVCFVKLTFGLNAGIGIGGMFLAD